MGEFFGAAARWRLPVVELAEVIGLSATPVRGAQALESSGAIEG